MTYDRYEPKGGVNHAGLGAAIRAVLRPDVPVIGPSTKGLSPGFHKQSDGKLMYVPDMAVIDKPPAVKRVKRKTAIVDIHSDATRPAGFYETQQSFWAASGDTWARHWNGTAWKMTSCAPCFVDRDMARCAASGHHIVSSEDDLVVLRALPELDALLDPVYDEPEGDNPEDAGEPEDLQRDATRPSGFYVTQKGEYATEYLRYWNSIIQGWATTGAHGSCLPERHRLMRWRDSDENTRTASDLVVLRARKDLDVMVAK